MQSHGVTALGGWALLALGAFSCVTLAWEPPVISSIGKTNGDFNLSVNEVAVIKGENFDSTAFGNSIVIAIPTNPGEKRYAVSVASASTTEIRFTVPEMPEVTVDGIDVLVELKVGNFPIVRVVNISRN
jgi:hypothetical protein